MRYKYIGVSVLALALGLGACGDGEEGLPSSQTRQIGAAGGELEAAGVRLTVPVGALAADTVITVSRTQLSPPADYTSYSKIYLFEPQHLTFETPVVVELSYPGGGTHPAIYFSKPDSVNEYYAVGGEVVGGRIRAQVYHLGEAFVAERNVLPTCGNGVLDSLEHCDGANLNGQSCVGIEQGFTGGTLACNATCDGWDTSQCTTGGKPPCDNGYGPITLPMNQSVTELSAGYAWSDSGVALSVEQHPEASAFYAGFAEGQLTVAPAMLKVELGSLSCAATRVEFDVIDWCGGTCTMGRAYVGTQEVASQHASGSGSSETLTLISEQPLDYATAGSFEGAILAVRIY